MQTARALDPARVASAPVVERAAPPVGRLARPGILVVTMLDRSSKAAVRRAARWAVLFDANLHVRRERPK